MVRLKTYWSVRRMITALLLLAPQGGGAHTALQAITHNIPVPPGRFNVAHGVAVDSAGNVYVAEVRSRGAQKVLRIAQH